MARLARVVAPGVAHHVTQRGNRRLAALRRQARTGRPLGAEPWLKRLEKRLAPRKAGRKPKAEQAARGATKKRK